MTSVTDHSAPTGRDDLDEDGDDLLLRQDDDLDGPGVQAWRRRTAIEMVLSGALGLLSAFVLSIEAWRLAGDPTANLSCDLSSVVSCSRVALSPQAELLGFPNAFLGIAFEVVVITLSVAVIGGVRFPRWFMVGTQALYTVALLFAYWLFVQSYFVIGALCPWCLLITVTTTLVWTGLTRMNVRDGNLPMPAAVARWARDFVATGNDWLITSAWLVLLVAAVAFKYGPSLIG